MNNRLLQVAAGTAVVVVMEWLSYGPMAAQSGGSTPLAIVNGEPISIQEVQTAASSEMKDIERRKVQLDAELERDRRAALDNALEGIVKDRVLAAEAKKRKISVPDLIAIEVDGAILRPTDEEVVEFYNTNKSALEGTLGDNANAIREYLRSDRRQPVLDGFVARLKIEYGVKSFVEPIRTAIDTSGRPAKGPANAPVTIVEFSDFECPFCRALFPTLQRLEDDYKDRLRVVYLQFPLVSIHTRARKAAEASLCAYEQGKFWQLHDAMFSEQQNLSVDDLKRKAAKLSLDMKAFNSCLESGKYLGEIQSDVEAGVKAGISGTPAMFINGRLLVGAQPYGEIQKIVEDELRRAKAE